MTFISTIENRGRVTLPPFRGIRIMMMPFHIHDPEHSLPDELTEWFHILRQMGKDAPRGVGYLTLDEALVRAGETHRRPGLHVDGIGTDGQAGGWGAGGGYGASGMTMVSSHVGCVAWNQAFGGHPKPDGDCAHLDPELDPAAAVVLQPLNVYWCGPMTVHKALPMPTDTHRQFCRVSYPSSAPWYEGYTENPLGIAPTGPVHARRAEYMGYRP